MYRDTWSYLKVSVRATVMVICQLFCIKFKKIVTVIVTVSSILLHHCRSGSYLPRQRVETPSSSSGFDYVSPPQKGGLFFAFRPAALA
jgi:hypothetical protein